MNEFDQWRSKYNSMTYKEQVDYHNDLEKRFPEQAHYNYGQVKKALDLIPYNIHRVLEIGCWKGDLAKKALQEYDIGEWLGIEICEEAIKKTHCTDWRFKYLQPEQFDWWNNEPPLMYATHPKVLIATHFIEHLSNIHFEQLVKWINGKPKIIYFEAPLSMEGQSWEGYYGTHKLNYGWNKVIDIMKEAGYKAKELLHQAVIFEYEDNNKPTVLR